MENTNEMQIIFDSYSSGLREPDTVCRDQVAAGH